MLHCIQTSRLNEFIQEMASIIAVGTKTTLMQRYTAHKKIKSNISFKKKRENYLFQIQ